MIRKPALLRVASAFCLLSVVSNILTPTVSYALTAGPTSPEATSFEPIDTTDMVNLPTGDFTYNMPLIEVPGPGGGYPLSLAYHAGIQPDVEASWVGLGWTLNPGAINRTVSGHPDDTDGTVTSARSFWKGETEWHAEIGVTAGMFGAPNKTANLSINHDTYRGFAGQISLGGLSATFTDNKVGASSNMVSMLKNGTWKSVDFSSAAPGLVNKRFGQIMNSINATGATIKSFKNSLGHLRSAIKGDVDNSQAGNLTSKGFTIPTTQLPTSYWLGFDISVGASYKRYKIDESVSANTYGTLYFPTQKLSVTNANTRAFDTYDLPYVEIPLSGTPEPPIVFGDDERYFAGTFADYDTYNVTAQGLAGRMRPYHFKAFLNRQEKKSSDGSVTQVQSYPIDGVNKKANFRFENDLSNRYLFSNNEFESPNGGDYLPYNATSPAIVTTGDNLLDGYEDTSNKLSGSKVVDSFSNSEILNPETSNLEERGFMECVARGFVRTAGSAGAIGAFRVTNESGVVYHYSLPVYSWEEYSYSGKTINGKPYYNQSHSDSKVASTWLLTAITGPDYVDNDENGIADSGDGGYWVTFEYGKWTDRYIWRNPSQGFNRDVDQAFHTASKGRKEVYYLDAIKTETHTAIFVKELRPDGKSVVENFPEIAKTVGSNTEIDYGGFLGYEGVNYPVSSLRLAKVLLFKSKDLVWDLPGLTSTYNHYTTQGTYHFGSQVIDIHDVNSLGSALTQVCLKGVAFNSNYELCNYTPNSYYSTLDNIPDTSPLNNFGKLTLKSVEVLGKGAQSGLIPPTFFDYDLDTEPMNVIIEDIDVGDDISLSIDGSKFPLLLAAVNANDIVTFKAGTTQYTALVTQKNSSIQLRQVPGFSPFEGGSVSDFRVTKNPTYTKEAQDIWGSYKSDYVRVPGVSGDSNTTDAGHFGSVFSAQSVDAWSLRKIVTPIGSVIRINYESDQYNSAIKELSNFEIKRVTSQDTTNHILRVQFYDRFAEGAIEEGHKYKIQMLVRKFGTTASPSYVKVQCNGQSLDEIYIWGTIDAYLKITGLDESTGAVYGKLVEYENYELTDEFRLWFKPPGDERKLIDKYIHGDSFEVTHDQNQPLYYFLSPAELSIGQLILPDKIVSYGGGLRVKDIAVENISDTRTTNYSFGPGITAYEPVGFGLTTRKISDDQSSCLTEKEDEKIKKFNSDFYFKQTVSKFIDLLGIARELPPPGVYYDKVVVKESISREGDTQPTEFPGSTEYQFEVFDLSQDHEMVTKTTADSNDAGSISGSPVINGLTTTTIYKGAIELEDFSAKLGSLKKVTQFDKDGNKLTETTTNYLHDGKTNEQYKSALEPYKQIGLIQETFVDGRQIKNKDDANYGLFGLISKRSVYPVLITSQTTKDYKTGIVTQGFNDEFDFYTGQVTKSRSTDEYGTTTISETTPAYRIYPLMGLGDFGHKNMLTQNAVSLSYHAQFENNEWAAKKLSGASVQTWSDDVDILDYPQNVKQQGIIRQSGTYSWMGNFPYNGGEVLFQNFVPFNFTENATNATWQRALQPLLYDKYSHTLEEVDMNNIRSATKMSSDQQYVLTSVPGAAYNEIAYSGAEDPVVSFRFGGDVLVEDGEVVTSAAADPAIVHTGTKSLSLSPNEKGFKYTFNAPADSRYRVSVWTNNSAGQLAFKIGSGSTTTVATTAQKKAGAWYLVEKDIYVPTAQTLEVWAQTPSGITANFDDFRLHPIHTPMTSFVYNKWDELSHTLDNNNMFTEYVYDSSGRLVEVFKEHFDTSPRKKVSKTIYKYAQPSAQ